MRISISIIPIGIVAASLSSPLTGAEGAVSDYWVRVMPAVWFPRLDGDIAYKGSQSASGTSIDAKELGINRRQASPDIEAGVDIPFLLSVDLGADGVSIAQTATLQRTVTYGNHAYAGGTEVHTTASLRDYWAELGIRPLNLDRVGFGIGVAGHVVRGRIELQDSTLGADDALAKTLVLPALALRAHVMPLPRLTIEGRVHVIDAGVGHQHARYIDALLQVAYRPIPLLGVLGGYRYTRYQLHLHDPTGGNTAAALDLRLGGPYVGLIAEF